MKPLQGVKVVDLTTYLAAPTTGRVLGEWGADVVKIESAKGDPARTQGAVFNMPFTDNENLAFDVANMNKRFITLNLKDPKGLEIAYKLLEEADVFLTNTRTKSLVKLGLDYDTLKEKFPRLIFAQVLGYGGNGPEKDTAGFDVTCYMARGGVFGTTVNRGDAPMIPTNGFGDFQVSLALASGICASLYAREKSGQGDKITISLHHSAVYALSTGLISAQYGNQYPKNRKATESCGFWPRGAFSVCRFPCRHGILPGRRVFGRIVFPCRCAGAVVSGALVRYAAHRLICSRCEESSALLFSARRPLKIFSQ